MLPGLMSFPPVANRQSLKNIITSLGLTTNLKLCLDAGDSASYSSGQSWLDVSGGGYDFFRGTANTSQTSDPTFNGSAGGLSAHEYWSFDGGDSFRYDTTNETWMQNLHKDNASFTFAAWVYFTSIPGTGALFGTTGGSPGSSGIGVRLVYISTREVVLTVNRSSSDVHALDRNSGLTIPLNRWSMVAVSQTEATGANGLVFFVNGSTALFSSTYSSPSSSSAAQTMEIAASGNQGWPLSSGSRMAMAAIWDTVALSPTQLAALYSSTKGRFGL